MLYLESKDAFHPPRAQPVLGLSNQVDGFVAIYPHPCPLCLGIGRAQGQVCEQRNRSSVPSQSGLNASGLGLQVGFVIQATFIVINSPT